ncbi:sugar phosphate isomerase/epimerase [Alpinimonas psychrophila]|uniref:Inosose dehydratase n=1 Tax=Alpinimonas psychrophila TaxID=748908 RepID=A0A7W3JRY2_9MICO|nr:TIM barrel protein [Alpinimonas psychrophila]MBA8828134.1 inosose dehydratase [Alpinimonas psychrophila]
MSQHKIAGAPISWGVCEVPGWGHQMQQDRVLSEMTQVGFSACEFGPLGFLPEEPALRSEVLKKHNLTAVGGFVPVVLYKADHDPEPEIRKELEAFRAAGAEVMVLAATTGNDDYNSRPELTENEWALLLRNLDKLESVAAEYGVRAVIHPHVGTIVEGPSDIERVVNGSGIGFCFDTGHMMIGGTDPVKFAQDHADRIGHVHLKDVRLTVAKRVIDGEINYYQGVIQGLYAPVGQGDVDMKAILAALNAAGYAGWYVLEQDNVLSQEPAVSEGPIEDAQASVDFLKAALAELD